MTDLKNDRTVVFIGLGHGISIGITQMDRLVIVYDGQASGAIDVKLSLGRATKARIDSIKESLDRLTIHARD